MTFAAVALLGMTVGQPLGPDYYPMNSRTIKLPIEYKKDRKSIRQVLLFVARNGENTWYQEGAVTPDKDAFVYIAKDDGVYWFKMVIEDLKGNKDPADLTRDPPDLKMLIDTTAPRIRVSNAKRNGQEVVVEWAVEEKFPDDAQTKVHFRPADNKSGHWQEVTLPSDSRTGVKFPCGTQDGVTVKITAVDLAGNRTEITQDYPAIGAAAPSTSLSPPSGGNTNSGTNPTPGAAAPPDVTPAPSGPGPLAPTGPVAPPVGPGPISAQPVVPVTPHQPPATGGNTGAAPVGAQPLATVDPKAPPAAALPAPGATPTGAWNGSAQPTVEVSRAQVINYPRFDLGFDLEQRGPSGISRVDLWVTRDEGKSWRKWKEYDGKGGTVRVMLDIPQNPQQEGSYGFRLVPVSGAGLSEREPAPGDAPDMRVVLDLTAPQIELFLPPPDPNAPPPPDTLVIGWQATDRNFGEEPITLEWSESPRGPWKSVASAGNEPVVQATAVAAPVAKRLANTGQFAWRVPAGVPPRVYLKATARDAAGNVREVVTREPILVDLTKPKAKINGIVPALPPRP